MYKHVHGYKNKERKGTYEVLRMLSLQKNGAIPAFLKALG